MIHSMIWPKVLPVELLERALLVRLLTAAAAEGDLQREPRDQEVRDAVAGEPDPGPDLDGPAVGDALGGGSAEWARSWRRSRHCRGVKVAEPEQPSALAEAE